MSGRLYRQVRAPGVVDDGPFPRPSGGRRPRAVPLKSVLGDAGADTGDPLAMVRGQRHALAISDAADAQCAGRLDDLSEHLMFQGRMPLEAKELQWEARVHGLPMPTAQTCVSDPPGRLAAW